MLQGASAARTTTLGAMWRPLGHRGSVRDAALPRLLAASVFAVPFGVGAHLAAGGAVPRNIGVLLGCVGLIAGSPWLADAVGRRTRGLLPAVGLVGTGQGGTELLLWCSGHGVRAPLLAVVLHAAAALVVTVLALGIERAATDLGAAADRSLPVLCWSTGPEPAVRDGLIAVTGNEDGPTDASWWPKLCPVRGPPLPL